MEPGSISRATPNRMGSSAPATANLSNAEPHFRKRRGEADAEQDKQAKDVARVLLLDKPSRTPISHLTCSRRGGRWVQHVRATSAGFFCAA
jgi:hypothetical protein